MTTQINENPHSWSYTFKQYLAPAAKCALASIAAFAIDTSGDMIMDLFRKETVVLALFSAGYDLYKRCISPAPYDLLSPLFWKTLERQNETNRDAPLALYTLPTSDHNGAYSGSISEAEILQMGDKKRLAIRSTGKPGEIKRTIHEVQEEIAPIQTMYIGGHGHPLSFDLGTKKYTLEENHSAIFEELEADEIKLMCCSTGSDLDPNLETVIEENIAERISQDTQKKVWAPTAPTDSFASVIYSRDDRQTGIHYYEGYDQKYRVFHPNGSIQSPTITAKEQKAIDRAWQIKIAHLSKAAKKGDVDALRYLTVIFLNKNLTSHSPEKALRCFIKARRLGSTENWNQIRDSIPN